MAALTVLLACLLAGAAAERAEVNVNIASCSGGRGETCGNALLQRVSSIRQVDALTLEESSDERGAARCDEGSWPDKDHGLVCGECKVLVNHFDSVYKTCRKYCEAVDRTCVGAWEEVRDTCEVDYTMTCDQTVASSDAICECGVPLMGVDPDLPKPGAKIRVASYNLFWWHAFGEESWKGHRITDNIKDSLWADVIGLQECDSVGLISERTGYMTASPFEAAQGVVMKPGLFKVGESGSRDLHATGKWGPRFVTWVQLTHTPSDRTFWHFNTHWCVHTGRGHTCNAETRHTGARNMLAVIREKVRDGAPIIVTGDFNADIDEPGPQLFLRNGFSLAINHWVDSIFYSTAHWRLGRTETGETAGSDHNPIIAELVFKE